MKQTTGITLISLVITIVVLLILAGVAISIAVSPDNIFDEAEEAKTKWKNAVDEEEIKVNNALGYLDNAPIVLPEGWDSSKISNVFTETSTIYGEEKERKVPIPKGFVASEITSEMNPEHPENTIENGLVIYQKEADETIDWTAKTVTKEGGAPSNLQETKNQYVWIPVDDINSMIMCKSNTGSSVCTMDLVGEVLKCTKHNSEDLCGRLYGYEENLDFTKRDQTWNETDCREPATLAFYDKDDVISGKNYMETAGIADKTVASFANQLSNDFKIMAKSVKKYGGFYVARYEAGNNGESKKNQIVLSRGSFDIDLLWYKFYNTFRKTGNETNSHMMWRKPV